MRIPVIRGTIERRLLVNFRVDPERLAAVLPEPFRPLTVDGAGIAGICLIRLARLRPRLAPLPWGLRSENAAHRIAVEWDEAGNVRRGVFIPRRDTNSWLNVAAGGRLFPGVHHHAAFRVVESAGHYSVAINSDDGQVRVAVDGAVTEDWPADSVFGSLAEASDFFEQGSLGYSPHGASGTFDGLTLETFDWQVFPLAVTRVESSYFFDRDRFPRGSVEFDNALLMRDVRHAWHAAPALCASPRVDLLARSESPVHAGA